MDPVITETKYLLTFYVALVAVMGPDIVREMRRRVENTEPKGRVHDDGSRRFLGLTGTAGIVVGISAVYLLPQLTIPYRHTAFWLGIAVLVLGGLIRQYAVRTLGNYFTTTVRARDNQQVVDSGPYQWVRHPSYTGGLLEYIGIGLVFGNWLSLLAVSGGLFLGYRNRIYVEEHALRDELGDPYQRFLNRTPYRLIPWVW